MRQCPPHPLCQADDCARRSEQASIVPAFLYLKGGLCRRGGWVQTYIIAFCVPGLLDGNVGPQLLPREQVGLPLLGNVPLLAECERGLAPLDPAVDDINISAIFR